MPAATGSTAAEPADGVLTLVRSHLPGMSDTMRRIADVLLDNPRAPLELSIGDLARAAGTSPATVTRFCRLLGYSGYVPLRVSMATDLGRSSAQESWSTDIGRAFRPDDRPADVLSTLLTAHTRSLRETADAIDLDALGQLATRIGTCRHLDIYGVGGSATLARELQSRLYRIGINAHVWSEVHDAVTSAAILDADCVAIALSNTGRTDETIEALQLAGTTGAYTVAITTNPRSPLAEVADQQIGTTVHERFLQPDDLSAKHAQLLVLDLLYLLVAQQNFDRTTTNLSASAYAVSGHRQPWRSRRRAAGAGQDGMVNRNGFPVAVLDRNHAPGHMERGTTQ